MKRRILQGALTVLGLAIASLTAVLPANASGTAHAVQDSPKVATLHATPSKAQSVEYLGNICAAALDGSACWWVYPASYPSNEILTQNENTYSDTTFDWIPVSGQWAEIVEDGNRTQCVSFDAQKNYFVMYPCQGGLNPPSWQLFSWAGCGKVIVSGFNGYYLVFYDYGDGVGDRASIASNWYWNSGYAGCVYVHPL